MPFTHIRFVSAHDNQYIDKPISHFGEPKTLTLGELQELLINAAVSAEKPLPPENPMWYGVISKEIRAEDKREIIQNCLMGIASPNDREIFTLYVNTTYDRLFAILEYTAAPTTSDEALLLTRGEPDSNPRRCALL